MVVFIDDMGWSDLSCFHGTRTKTENIDRLAEEGLRFTNFYDDSDQQLYALEADVSESRNIAEQNPNVIQRLHQLIMDWNASMPTDAGDPDWDPCAAPELESR